MNEIFLIHMKFYFSDNIEAGYLSNNTTITPKMNLSVLYDEDLKKQFNDVVFFLSRRYAQAILTKLRKSIDVEYAGSQVEYNIVKQKVSQQQLNTLMRAPWKYETA